MSCYLRSVSVAENTEVNDVTFKNLAGLLQLENLNLRNTPLTDASVPHFARLQSLRSLNLRGTQISAEGKRQIEIMLPNCVVFHNQSDAGTPHPEGVADYALAFDGRAAFVDLEPIGDQYDGPVTIEATVVVDGLVAVGVLFAQPVRTSKQMVKSVMARLAMGISFHRIHT